MKRTVLRLGKYHDIPATLNLHESVNPHILLVGTSGSGKTAQAQCIINQLAQQGQTIVAFDSHNCLADEEIFEPYREIFHEYCREWNVKEDGIPVDLLTPIEFADGDQETDEDVMEGVEELFSRLFRIGARQHEALLFAVENMYARGNYNTLGLKALDYELRRIGTHFSQSVRSNLSDILNHNIFRPGSFAIEAGRINVFRISRFAFQTQNRIVEITLAYIWRLANAGKFKDSPIFIFLDEVQNYMSGVNSIVATILREGRKMGVNLITCTQILDPSRGEIMKGITISDTILYFRPPNDHLSRIARLIESESVEIMSNLLRGLRPGEFIATGSVLIGNEHTDRPVRISNRYEELRCM